MALTTLARKFPGAGSMAAPLMLHSSAVTVSFALTRIIPMRPAASPAGQPAATASPGTAPGSGISCPAQDWGATAAKSIVTEVVRSIGTTAVSTETVDCPPLLETTTPVPALSAAADNVHIFVAVQL